MHVCMSVCMYVCLSVCMYVCMCIYIYTYKALARAECDTRDLCVAMCVIGSSSLVALISFGLWTDPLRLLVSCSAGDDKPAWLCVQESLQESLQHALRLQPCQTCRTCLALHHDGSNRSLVPRPVAVGLTLDLDLL